MENSLESVEKPVKPKRRWFYPTPGRLFLLLLPLLGILLLLSRLQWISPLWAGLIAVAGVFFVIFWYLIERLRRWQTSGSRIQFIVILTLLTLHLAGDLYLYFTIFQPHIYRGGTAEIIIDYGYRGRLYDYEQNSLRLLAIFGFLLGQASLLALWAGRSAIKSYIRIPLALFGVAGLCFIVCRHFKGMPLTELNPADYFYLYGFHALFIILILTSLRISSVLFGKRPSKESLENAKKAQFTIASMLIWTTALALMLGLGKLALGQPGVMPTNMSLDFLIAIGIYNAVLALLAFTVVLGYKARWRWELFLLVLILLLGLIQPLSWSEIYLIDLKTNPFLELASSPYKMGMGIGFMVLANIQILTIYATLIPLRWCKLLDEKRMEAILPASASVSQGNENVAGEGIPNPLIHGVAFDSSRCIEPHQR